MADAAIQDDVEVGGLPGSPNIGISSTPGKLVRVDAAASREYVSASSRSWFSTLPRALPWHFDDITTDFGSDIYERLLLDAQVRASFNVMKASILDTGPVITSAVDRKEDDGYDQAKQLVDDAERMIDNLTTSIDDVLWDMLDHMAFGNKMAEMVFSLDQTTSGKQQYALTTLAVKPRESVAFVVDAYMNVLGILGRIPGQPFSVQQGTLLADIEHTANLLPRSKFAILSFRPRNGDPRGQSVLRPAFDPWNQKQELKKEYLKYLTQFASPSLVGFTAENAQPYTVLALDGTASVDGNGNPLIRTPEDDMLAALVAFSNGTATAFPFGARVQPIEMTGDGSPFLEAFQFLDNQIVKAILHQTLATEEGEHQSRAASGTHKDILDTIIRQGKRPVEHMLEHDILATWIRLNKGEKLLELMPSITLGSAGQEDLAGLWAGVASLQGSDYLHASQYADLDKLIGLPERTPPDATTMPVKEQITVAEVGGTVPEPAGSVPPTGTPAVTPPGNGKAATGGTPPVAKTTPNGKAASASSGKTAASFAADEKRTPPTPQEIADRAQAIRDKVGSTPDAEKGLERLDQAFAELMRKL